VEKQLGQDAESISNKHFMVYQKIKDAKDMPKKNLSQDFLAKCLEANN
jgi:hypothetical protein